LSKILNLILFAFSWFLLALPWRWSYYGPHIWVNFCQIAQCSILVRSTLNFKLWLWIQILKVRNCFISYIMYNFEFHNLPHSVLKMFHSSGHCSPCLQGEWSRRKDVAWYVALAVEIKVRVWSVHDLYMPQGHGFGSRWCHRIFQLTSSFQPHYGPGVVSASNRNEYQESSWG
jgi:hypothetical protein